MLENRLDESILEISYKSGKSMQDISRQLNCSVHKVVYWMDKYDLKRRTRSEATYIKANPSGDPFKIKIKLSPREKTLYGLGLGIYWGEGNKVTPHAVSVSNTDSKIIKVFIRFLEIICNVRKDKIKYSLVCFNNSNLQEVAGYWSEQLSVNFQEFGKIVQIPPQGKGTYRNKSGYGVCAVRVNNIKLKSWIMSEIDKIGDAWIV